MQTISNLKHFSFQLQTIYFHMGFPLWIEEDYTLLMVVFWIRYHRAYHLQHRIPRNIMQCSLHLFHHIPQDRRKDPLIYHHRLHPYQCLHIHHQRIEVALYGIMERMNHFMRHRNKSLSHPPSHPGIHIEAPYLIL